MGILRELGFSGRFKALKIGVIVDFSHVTDCLRNILIDLSADNADCIILDIQGIYRIEDGYFDIIFYELPTRQANNTIYNCYSLISGGGLLLEIISDEKAISPILSQLVFQKVIRFTPSNSDAAYKCLLYRNNEF